MKMRKVLLIFSIFLIFFAVINMASASDDANSTISSVYGDEINN